MMCNRLAAHDTNNGTHAYLLMYLCTYLPTTLTGIYHQQGASWAMNVRERLDVLICVYSYMCARVGIPILCKMQS